VSEFSDNRIPELTRRERLIVLVRQIVGGTAARLLPIDARLSDLGMSSIKMVNFMLAVEAEFNLIIPQHEITPDNFHSIATVESLILRLDQRAASSTATS
jgi:acyl carrier protein